MYNFMLLISFKYQGKSVEKNGQWLEIGRVCNSATKYPSTSFGFEII